MSDPIMLTIPIWSNQQFSLISIWQQSCLCCWQWWTRYLSKWLWRPNVSVREWKVQHTKLVTCYHVSNQYYYFLQKYTDWVDQFRDRLRGSVLPRGVLQGDGGARVDPGHGHWYSDLGLWVRGCSQMTSAIFGVSDTPWCLCQPIISFWPAPYPWTKNNYL